ncbi:response regulator [Pseudodesulfovibrio pelocollis]|uniref:response regulator n=1 Tax=Pseudodesulfovibrio pelocollis TaxID=3051432 RepID=UPI00255B0AC9|nr:response regulator [Pseudodesulfovibrio sp. SB368]
MRILIVDDDESIGLYLQTVLAPFARCDGASSGEDGLLLFRQAHDHGRPYDVVMMDILMPGMDGHEAAETMRALEADMGIASRDAFKLVMITSLVDDANVTRAFFKAHATCYLVKPFDKESVLDELRQNLVL